MTRILDALVAGAISLSFMQWALIVGGLFILALIVAAQRANDNFDVRHLIADGDVVSRYAFAYMLGATVLTWAFIYYAWNSKVGVYEFVAYGVLMMFPEAVKTAILPILARRFNIDPKEMNDEREAQERR